MKDFSGDRQGSSVLRRVLGKTMWMISISRNSIVVIMAMILAYILQNNGYEPFRLTGIKFIKFKNDFGSVIMKVTFVTDIDTLV